MPWLLIIGLGGLGYLLTRQKSAPRATGFGQCWVITLRTSVGCDDPEFAQWYRTFQSQAGNTVESWQCFSDGRLMIRLRVNEPAAIRLGRNEIVDPETGATEWIEILTAQMC